MTTPKLKLIVQISTLNICIESLNNKQPYILFPTKAPFFCFFLAKYQSVSNNSSKITCRAEEDKGTNSPPHLPVGVGKRDAEAELRQQGDREMGREEDCLRRSSSQQRQTRQTEFQRNWGRRTRVESHILPRRLHARLSYHRIH